MPVAQPSTTCFHGRIVANIIVLCSQKIHIMYFCGRNKQIITSFNNHEKQRVVVLLRFQTVTAKINVELNEPASRNVGQQPLGRHYSRCEPQRKFNLHNSKSVILREQVICVYLIPLFDFNHRVMVQITGRNSISRLKKNVYSQG